MMMTTTMTIPTGGMVRQAQFCGNSRVLLVSFFHPTAATKIHSQDARVWIQESSRDTSRVGTGDSCLTLNYDQLLRCWVTPDDDDAQEIGCGLVFLRAFSLFRYVRGWILIEILCTETGRIKWAQIRPHTDTRQRSGKCWVLTTWCMLVGCIWWSFPPGSYSVAGVQEIW